MELYNKLRISLRYFLLGKEYFHAADALEFASAYHSGTRKDGITPEFQHQIEIAHYMRTLLPWFAFPQETLTVCLLHDVTEDYGVLNNIIRQRYGDLVADAVAILDKNGKEPDFYFAQIGSNAITSLVKGSDRMHNLQTMNGVFTVEKQQKYLGEVEKYFLPMLKIARHNFPVQEAAYENIKHILTTQTELLDLLIVCNQK